MDLTYINPFIQAAINIINELIGIDVRKDQVYVQRGKKSSGGIGIVLDVTKDVDGRIIFDFTQDMVKTFAKEMVGLNLSSEEELLKNKELLESAILELGNMISGKAVTLLEANNYDCDITPPKVYLGKNKRLADENTVCIIIDFMTSYGGFSMCLTNKQSEYLENISIAMSNINDFIQDSLVFAFLPKGFALYNISDLQKLKMFIAINNIDFLLLNTDNIENLKEELSNIKLASKNDNLKIIGYTKSEDPDIYDELFDELISYSLPPSLDENQVVSSFKNFLEKVGIRHTERRKHIRIDVDPEENINITFPIERGDIFIEGKVINISIGGALFHSEDKEKLSHLPVGTRIEALQITIDEKIVRTSAVVVYRKDNLTAVRFINLKNSFLKVLAKYIFKLLSKSAE